MKNVIVDIGNMEIKFAGEARGKFSSKYSTRFEINPEAYERIELDGIQTLIGVGEYEREFNKADKNIIPQVLYAISKATKDNDVNLCLLMPLNQLPQKERVIEKFKSKSFKFAINGQTKTIKINKCTVLPESQSAYYSLQNPSNFQMLIDIGSRTVGWCCYEYGKMVNSGTEKLGVFDLYNKIMVVENAKGNDFIVEDIQGQINRKRIIVEEKIYKEFLVGVLNRIKANVNIKNYDCTFIGGGSLILKDIINKIPNVEIYDNAVYANAIGAEAVCKRVWK